MLNIKEKVGDVIEVSIIWDTRKKENVGRYYPKPDFLNGITSRGITCFQSRYGKQVELVSRGLYKARIEKILERSLIVRCVDFIGYWEDSGGVKHYLQSPMKCLGFQYMRLVEVGKNEQ